MPITFSVTCDSDEELARFLEGFRLDAQQKKRSGNNTTTTIAHEEEEEAPKAATAAAPARAPKKAAGRPAGRPKATGIATKSKPTKAPKSAATKPGRTPKAVKAVVKKSPGRPPATQAKSSTTSKRSSNGTSASAKAVDTSAGRRTGKLTPVIQEAIQEISKKGNPFRSREVIEYIMKRSPELNENSVTTGVSKSLSESNLKWDQIKDAVGRPYKMYKP